MKSTVIHYVLFFLKKEIRDLSNPISQFVRRHDILNCLEKYRLQVTLKGSYKDFYPTCRKGFE